MLVIFTSLMSLFNVIPFYLYCNDGHCCKAALHKSGCRFRSLIRKPEATVARKMRKKPLDKPDKWEWVMLDSRTINHYSICLYCTVMVTFCLEIKGILLWQVETQEPVATHNIVTHTTVYMLMYSCTGAAVVWWLGNQVCDWRDAGLNPRPGEPGWDGIRQGI